ncbi:cytochrome b/b6 domain-containing protein [Thermodesulfitimonas autotrophica]|uniref:cytochrome b/b6 domain-containing protein n=1 Tax=Thermodesulfitimonas autotrophica TaxID=1894989 RepID=UPI002FE07807
MEKMVVLRHSVPSRITHIVLMICWIILAATGFAVYFKLVGEVVRAAFMQWHIYFAIPLTFVTLGYLVVTPDRAFMFAKELLSWDRDTIAWWKNLGGYPYKLFKIGSPGSPPQSKYNAGQKFYGLCVVATLAILGVTGWSLYFIPQALGKFWTLTFFKLHVWLSFFVTLFMLFVHVPLVIYNWPDFKAMFRFGPGTVPLEWAREHNPKWVEKELALLKED